MPTATCAKPSYCQMAKETVELLGVVAVLGGRSETKGGEGLDRSQSAHVALSTPLSTAPGPRMLVSPRHGHLSVTSECSHSRLC